MAESVSAAQSKLVVMPWEPAQSFCPLTLAMVAVRVVREREAAGHGKVMRAIVELAVPALRQKVKRVESIVGDTGSGRSRQKAKALSAEIVPGRRHKEDGCWYR